MSDHEEEETHHEGEGEESQEFAESFFESFDRVPSGVSLDNDLRSSDSDSDSDDSPDNVRISFASAVAPPSFRRLNFDDLDEIIDNQEKEKLRKDGGNEENEDDEDEEDNSYDYKMWMAEPMSIQERRKKLFQGMGLASNKKLPVHSKSRKLPPNLPLIPTKSRAPSARYISEEKTLVVQKPENLPLRSLDRCKSENRLALHDSPVFASLFRVSSAPPSKWRKWSANNSEKVILSSTSNENLEQISPETGVITIKNLDNGKKFVVTADGAVENLNDPQTGLQISVEELEKFVGYSPIVKEVLKRVTDANKADITANGNGNLSTKSRAKSSKKKVSWLKNIKFMASTVTSLISEKEREGTKEKDKSSERLKVHQHGKPYKELTGLYMCQEIQAHQGSIWTMKFSCDSRYMASAGEDRVVNVWQVIECDANATPLNKKENMPRSPGKQPPLAKNGSNRLGPAPSKKGKKGKGVVPDNIVMPETVFSLSSEPVCSFEGHLDDVLDLSWSKSQLLLSSSMDKTVRLWDIESKACLKLFAHNDYVTCIQFNPIDERYFISGSLDAKVRIWSIPNRQVVDWTDMHEMVTAACYTPDGQGALVGSHKGNCRFYNTTDAKLSQEGQIDVTTKKRKSNPKKITGFQFTPDNSSEVLITSADSQIRVFDGIDMIHKFRGFRNVNSQLSASCTMDGKYVVCASEDSHVYIWKRDRSRMNSASKGVKITTRSHEHFVCKGVTVAIPWPNGSANCEPSPDLPHWSRRPHYMRSPSNLEDTFGSCRSMDAQEEHNSPRAIGSSSSSFLGSSFVGSSSSSFSSWGWGTGSNRIANDIEEANAWGLVVVTGGFAGNIRIYQNFGLPFRLNRL